jgi:D-beta-D-heptose 7-phosphate kinase/D-beta-D-heptose 1-phosphate adenosyltransferase
VVGDALLDSYAHGQSRRICREAPVPVLEIERRDDAPGGAANAAVNAAALGASVRLLSVTGDDPAAARLRSAQHARGLAADGLLPDRARRTLVKERLVAGGQILLRVDEGDAGPIRATAERALLGRLERAWPETDAVLLSDYGYGTLAAALLQTVRRLQVEEPRLLVVDARELRRFRALGANAVKPNADEASALLGHQLPEDTAARVAFLRHRGHALLRLAGAPVAAVTLDRAGALILERDGSVLAVHRTHGRPCSAARATGAGDSFASAFALGLAAGGSVRAAAELATAAANVVVGKDGTATCSAAELRASLDGGRLQRRPVAAEVLVQ